MIVHIALFKLKPGVPRDDPRVVAAIERLAALKDSIDGIVDWEVARNITERPVTSDVALYSTFTDREALAAYGPHPAHREFVEAMREIAEWTVVDYER